MCICVCVCAHRASTSGCLMKSCVAFKHRSPKSNCETNKTTVTQQQVKRNTAASRETKGGGGARQGGERDKHIPDGAVDWHTPKLTGKKQPDQLQQNKLTNRINYRARALNSPKVRCLKKTLLRKQRTQQNKGQLAQNTSCRNQPLSGVRMPTHTSTIIEQCST